MAIIINGRAIANKIINNLKSKPTPNKSLIVEMIGQNPAAHSFLEQKKRVAEKLRIPVILYLHNYNAGNYWLWREINEFNQRSDIGGITISLPLPSEYNQELILNSISPLKDVDCLNAATVGVEFPAVGAVKKICESLQFNLADKKVAVVGTGFLVGQPITKWLSGQVEKIFVLNSKSDLSILKEADLVISGVGKPGLIKPEMLKNGAGVIDFGYGGDLQTAGCSLDHLNFYTPAYGGVGPILVACLFENFYKLTNKL